ncbi:glycosyltransferase family 2 protein [Aequorivita echinoideorum]|uniref:Glycosyltransferase n=1 Tax=Aequorivita echinoideorum TaxID=1549647 RepID=A0ABS5S5H5_9FLAO|nr:glycosyltransferase [Aequorivita echinoideorum]MBT0608462.1 glycosyltransferase [Aequorivita echinoideorum]
MKFSLIICTYMRPQPLLNLLRSVEKQTVYPDEVLVVDGSTNTDTEEVIQKNSFKNISYFKVGESQRGLTKQRNFGIQQVGAAIEIVCFLDDDIVLTETYFEELLKTYTLYPQALGVGGYIVNEVLWEKTDEKPKHNEFACDGWKRKDGSRFVLRKKLGLDADRPPAYFPDFGHGRSVSFLPPSGKIYGVEQFMGGVASYKKEVFETQKFSEYFEGYGLYEDADFTLRLSKKGQLYVNTAAQLYHYHETSGRPDHFKYGKMVVRNGWYVWRVKNPKPSIKARFKWNATAFLLTAVRLSNAITSSDKKTAFKEALGRAVGWFSLLFNKPKIR